MTGADERPAPQAPLRTPATGDRGTVEQRIERWASMLDDAVHLLNQVMSEVKETGRTDDDRRGH